MIAEDIWLWAKRFFSPLLNRMTATVSWQWTLLLLNRENCALKFWVIEFVKVIILLYNTICRFSEGSNLGKGETFMKLPLADHLAHIDTQEGTDAVSCFTLLLAVVRLVQGRWKCCGRPQIILCYSDIKSSSRLKPIALRSPWCDTFGFKQNSHPKKSARLDLECVICEGYWQGPL